jgi:hypothetical protein
MEKKMKNDTSASTETTAQTTTAWEVIFDHRTMDIYVLASKPGQPDSDKVLAWAKEAAYVATLYGAPLAVLDLTNVVGEPPTSIDPTPGYGLAGVVVMAEYGGPMPSPQKRLEFGKKREWHFRQAAKLGITWRVANPDWDDEPVTAEWFDVACRELDLTI